MTKTLNIQPWDGPDAITCARDLARKPYSLFFDSNRASHPLNKWSFICFDPIERIEIKNGVIKHNNEVIEETDFFQFLQSRLDAYNFETTHTDIPFIGGAAGYFGYDLGRQLEKLPNDTIDDLNTADACVGIYTNILAFNHSDDTAWFIGDIMPALGSVPLSPYITRPIRWTTNKSSDEYKADIQKTLGHIYAGEIYQANISRRFEAPLPDSFNHFSHYEYLRKINPAPFSAYMNFGDLKMSSCSPEQFLSVHKNIVTTRPIKGTASTEEDEIILTNSEKDIAENTMIVDLLRNDISKVCDHHSVKVPELCQIQTFENLHHLVSTITGTLRENKKPTDLLRACFPGGSVTGAPKIRAQEIIEEIEENRRGPYCGSMGYIGFNDKMDSNIIIRTLIYSNDKVYLQTGGGIVADSTPQQELQETLDKASKLFESFANKNSKKETST